MYLVKGVFGLTFVVTNDIDNVIRRGAMSGQGLGGGGEHAGYD
jgi:hypothetical protein